KTMRGAGLRTGRGGGRRREASMSIFQKPSRHQFIVTSCVLVWIFIVNVAAIALGIAGWPLYFVTIFFFALGADMKNVPSIFAGGTLGLIAALGLHAGTFGLAPSLGLLGAFSVSIAIVLAVIILGGTVCPVACNNVSFAYLTFATVNFAAMPPSVIGYQMVVFWVGGAIILGGSLAAASIGNKIAAAGAPAPEAAPEEESL